MDPITSILGPAGTLTKSIPGFSVRQPQLRMAQAVSAALAAPHHLLVEAGTGTGKTFGYLVPALLATGRTVISTGTRVLQDQIFERDLKALSGSLDVVGRVALLKGRSNYLCRYRFRSFAERTRRIALTTQARDALVEWAHQTDVGDIAEVSFLAEDHAVWREVTVNSEQCLGSRCPDFDDCYITEARRRAMAADVIVVNHHLLFADLGVRSGAFGEVIPSYDAVVLDEAHQVEEVATAFFGIRISGARLRDLAGDIEREAVSLEGDDAGRITADARRLVDRWQPVHTQLAHQTGGEGGRRPLRLHALGPVFLDAMNDLLDALRLLAVSLAAREGHSEAIYALARRAETILAELECVVADPPTGDAPEVVNWFEVRGAGSAIGQSPLAVGPLLRQHLYSRVKSAIFTSATLVTGGDMAYIRERLGLGTEAEPRVHVAQVPATSPGTTPGRDPSLEPDHPRSESIAPGAVDLSLPAPFDYRTQALLYLPNHLPSPKDGGFDVAAADEITCLTALSGGRALLLFTSYRRMEAVYRRCVDRLPGLVLKQGDMPRRQLLSAMVDRAPATLFATGSFWQGVDIPGEPLSLVVIDRLPFAAPDDPVLLARAAALRASGRNPFTEMQVPMASLGLKQGVGRLIRTPHDRGVVAVLDHRIQRTGYGRVFLDALPPMPRTDRRTDVATFFARGPTAAPDPAADPHESATREAS